MTRLGRTVNGRYNWGWLQNGNHNIFLSSPLFPFTLHSHLVFLLQAGDQTATVLTLCAMLNLNLMQEIYQLAIWDLGGLEVLLNLLDTKEERCHVSNRAKHGPRRLTGGTRAGHVCQSVPDVVVLEIYSEFLGEKSLRLCLLNSLQMDASYYHSFCPIIQQTENNYI